MGLAPNQAFAADREDHAPAETRRSALIGVLVLNSIWQGWYFWQLRGKPQSKPVRVCQRLEFKDFPGILVVTSAFEGRFVWL
jgi:hypothetical protein